MATQGVDLALSPAALLERCAAQPHPFLIDGGTRDSWGCGRALLGFRPHALLRVLADRRALLSDTDGERALRGDPLELLEGFSHRHARGDGDFPGLVVVALSYDLGPLIERVRLTRPPAADATVLFAAAYDWVLEHSYADSSYHLRRRPEVPVAAILAQLHAPAATPPSPSGYPLLPELAKQIHLARVARALEEIRAGNIYQVNLAQRFVSTAPPVPVAAFTALQQRHPMPYAAYFDLGDCVLVSNSPECLVELRGRNIATSPIKGTRPRGSDPRADRAQVEELGRDAKERAEHVMIVDLERNDLGRVCEIGSVQVSELMKVASFGSLHHLVSRVTGRLRATVGLAEMLRSMFPGGSISGCPKLRALEIINQLEPSDRGFYTGAIGFVGGDDAVFNIAIRTAVIGGGRLIYHAGGGIVSDSDPEREYDETLLKAQPFVSLLAAGAA